MPETPEQPTGVGCHGGNLWSAPHPDRHGIAMAMQHPAAPCSIAMHLLHHLLQPPQWPATQERARKGDTWEAGRRGTARALRRQRWPWLQHLRQSRPSPRAPSHVDEEALLRAGRQTLLPCPQQPWPRAWCWPCPCLHPAPSRTRPDCFAPCPYSCRQRASCSRSS